MPDANLISSLQRIAASNIWPAILPELMLACIALGLLVLEMVLPSKKHNFIPSIAISAQIGVLGAMLYSWNPGAFGDFTFGGLLHHSKEGDFLRVFFLLCSILVCALGMISLAKQKVPKTEFFHIVMVITAAMMLLVQSNHFVMLFVALETVTIGFYVLVSYFRSSPLSLEAGLKYLIMGALSSAILLFGIVLLYGVAGNPQIEGATGSSFEFTAIRFFLEQNSDNFVASIGVALVLAGVAFKIGAVPFQIWVPDVYQGAPTPVTAFLAVASKAAGFGVLLNLTVVFAPMQHIVIPTLAVMAGATIILGNLTALTQHNVKRLMGLSGVSHAGYLLLGVIASCSEPGAVGAVYFYLFAYLLASMAVFAVMAHVADTDDAIQELDHYTDLARRSPFLAAILTVGVGSLAGIPPLAGFMGKLMIFVSAFKAGLYPLLFIAIAGVAVSIYYYFSWIKAAYFPVWRAPLPEGKTEIVRPLTPVSGMFAGMMLLLALASIAFGFYPGPLANWLSQLG